MAEITAAKTGTAQSSLDGLKEGVALLAAFLFMVGYLALNVLLIVQQEQFLGEQWERSMILYKGVEALALTATGYLFGREVNRDRADRAEQVASETQQRASEAEQGEAEERAKGRAFAEVVKGLPERQHSELEATRSQAEISQVKRLAQSLYP